MIKVCSMDGAKEITSEKTCSTTSIMEAQNMHKQAEERRIKRDLYSKSFKCFASLEDKRYGGIY